jgi:hypothetical protein
MRDWRKLQAADKKAVRGTFSEGAAKMEAKEPVFMDGFEKRLAEKDAKLEVRSQGDDEGGAIYKVAADFAVGALTVFQGATLQFYIDPVAMYSVILHDMRHHSDCGGGCEADD